MVPPIVAILVWSCHVLLFVSQTAPKMFALFLGVAMQLAMNSPKRCGVVRVIVAISDIDHVDLDSNLIPLGFPIDGYLIVPQ